MTVDGEAGAGNGKAPYGLFGSKQEVDEMVHYEDIDNDDEPYPCGVEFAMAATNMRSMVTCPECLNALSAT